MYCLELSLAPKTVCSSYFQCGKEKCRYICSYYFLYSNSYLPLQDRVLEAVSGGDHPDDTWPERTCWDNLPLDPGGHWHQDSNGKFVQLHWHHAGAVSPRGESLPSPIMSDFQKRKINIYSLLTTSSAKKFTSPDPAAHQHLAHREAEVHRFCL